MASKTILFSLVALMLALLAANVSAEQPISHNATVRRHAAIMVARPARRSIDMGPAKRFEQKRQTAEQLAQAAELKKWNDDFQTKNAEWQQAAIAALNKGQTPPSYDEYWSGKSGSTSTGSSSSNNASTESSSSASDSSSSSDASSSDKSSSNNNSNKSSSTPSNKSSDSSSTSNNTDDSSSREEDCVEDESTTEDATPTSTASSEKSTATSNNKQLAKDNSNKESASQTTSSKAAASSTSSSAASSSSSSSSSTSGQGTYFAPGLGACGWTNSASDHIVAISHSLFDSFGTGNPNNNPACGHKIKANYQGKSTTVTVVDRCEGCAWGDLDFTATAFKELASLSVGRLSGVTWEWVGSAP
ncbi:hypothetical protein BCV70DRAFT_77743 [Testicularia cyperi]|uniref:RlpA-like protein double-psi beta-barrel domain-containing protein n=1 Tax=Testicularia cyperi TaxID=1882483 RepID=A0A317XTN1_9BASI|nr:hypothetical protein BCV70DRAFT_77743 [Testicularia cyperi]